MKRIALVLILALAGIGCDDASQGKPQSDSGVSKATARVTVGSDGLTVEQRNIAERVKRDNHLGAVKHLYIISPYSGQVLIYSTVVGKVTSGGKRLTPKTISRWDNGAATNQYPGFYIKIGSADCYTNEVLQDDGTYGDSQQYLYWFDQRGVYHQHYVGNEILHISDQPMKVGSVVINMETQSVGPVTK